MDMEAVKGPALPARTIRAVNPPACRGHASRPGRAIEARPRRLPTDVNIHIPNGRDAASGLEAPLSP